MEGGVCKTKSMKLVLRVGQSECHTSCVKPVPNSETLMVSKRTRERERVRDMEAEKQRRWQNRDRRQKNRRGEWDWVRKRLSGKINVQKNVGWGKRVRQKDTMETKTIGMGGIDETNRESNTERKWGKRMRVIQEKNKVGERWAWGKGKSGDIGSERKWKRGYKRGKKMQK